MRVCRVVCRRRQVLRPAPSSLGSLALAKLIAVGKGKLVVSYYMLCWQVRGDAIQTEGRNQWLPLPGSISVHTGIYTISGSGEAHIKSYILRRAVSHLYPY